MHDNQGTNRLAARLALAGIKRRRAAGATYVSYSALNRKLRGDRPLSAADAQRLNQLAVRGRPAPKESP